MKEKVEFIIEKYLKIYPDEKERQAKFIEYLKTHNENEIIDWNNFDGHITAGGFIYAKQEKKFLLVYHKMLQMYLYPGGHSEVVDSTPLDTAKREVKEETGIIECTLINENEEIVPIDIDTHKIPYDEKRKLPEHYHFDFRYLFVIEKITDVNIDAEELQKYEWIGIEELSKHQNYGRIIEKIKNIIKEKE